LKSALAAQAARGGRAPARGQDATRL